MRIERHAKTGLWCREDGAIYIPGRKAHWTFGTPSCLGYATVKYHFKVYYVHRLVAEAFLLNPASLPTVDHIDRNKSNNAVHNLRWASYKTQADNRSSTDRGLQRYGVRRCDNRNAYARSLYRNNSEFREHQRVQQHEYYLRTYKQLKRA